jgi:hypothetical protein
MIAPAGLKIAFSILEFPRPSAFIAFLPRSKYRGLLLHENIAGKDF